jgi:hypothetical protein
MCHILLSVGGVEKSDESGARRLALSGACLSCCHHVSTHIVNAGGTMQHLGVLCDILRSMGLDKPV